MAMELETSQSELGFPYWKPIRRRFAPDSPFFASGNIERELLVKQIALDLTEDEKRQLRDFVEEQSRSVFCPIVGCGARLNCLEQFEDHYNAKVARGDPMYECLVEGCDLKLKTYKSRQQHLVDKHKFPTSFEFFKKAQPSKKQRLKNQRKQYTVKKADASGMEVENEAIVDPSRKQKKKNPRKQANIKKADASNMEVENVTIDSLVSAVSKLSTSDSSPSSISFGRRPTRGLTFVPRAAQHEKKPDCT